MNNVKRCECGRTIILDHDTAEENELGYWQDCECESTHFFQREDEPTAPIIPLTNHNRAGRGCQQLKENIKTNFKNKQRMIKERQEKNRKVLKEYKIAQKGK